MGASQAPVFVSSNQMDKEAGLVSIVAVPPSMTVWVAASFTMHSYQSLQWLNVVQPLLAGLLLYWLCRTRAFFEAFVAPCGDPAIELRRVLGHGALPFWAFWKVAVELAAGV